jgi:hypothetical protein
MGVYMDTTNMGTTNTESTNPETANKDAKKRPTVVTIAAVLLIVLSLFVAGLGIANQFGLLGQGFGNRQFIAGQGRNRNFTPPSGSQSNGFPQNGSPQNGFPQNGFPSGQTGQGTTRNFTFTGRGNTGLAGILRILRPITIALDLILLGLSIIAAIGLFMYKRWAIILAIVVSALVILLTIPSMIRIFSTVTLIENLVRILMAVAVIVLLLLPASRKAYATSRPSEEEVERIVR